jgi:hypothetical protein
MFNNSNTNNNGLGPNVANLQMIPSPEMNPSGGGLNPPAGDYFLVSNTGAYLVSDTGVYLISNH